MQFLSSIYDAICHLFDSIGTIITFFLSSLENVGILISKFPIIFESFDLVSGFFPFLFLNVLSSLLSLFIAIRVLRFITLQG